MTETQIPGGVVAWEDPPPPPSKSRPLQRTSANWKLMAEQLRERPNTWAKLAVGPAAQAQHSRIVGGKTGNWRPAGAFLATTREIDGEVHLWAMYVGPPAEGL